MKRNSVILTILVLLAFAAMAIGSGSSSGGSSSTPDRSAETSSEDVDNSIATAASSKDMHIGDVSKVGNVYVGLSYVKRMPYLPTALGTDEVPDGFEVIYAFFDFYNGGSKTESVNPRNISCYADGVLQGDVESYIKVKCDDVLQFHTADMDEKTKLLSVQDFQVKEGWQQLQFYYGSSCIWTVTQDEVSSEAFSAPSLYEKSADRQITPCDSVIYSDKYEVIYKGCTLYHKNNVVFGDTPYAVFKYQITNTGNEALDTSLYGYKMRAYQNEYMLGDADYVLSDNIDGYNNIFSVDRIESGMTADVFVAFEAKDIPGSLYMVYDDGYIISNTLGSVCEIRE